MLRSLIFIAFLFAAPALAGPPGLGPPGLEHRGPPPPGIMEDVKARELEILKVVKFNDPGRYEQLMEAKESDERAYWRQMVHIARMVERFAGDPEFARRSLEMRDLQRKIKDLGRDFESPDPREQRAIRAEMEALGSRLFEMKQAERRERLSDLQRKIDNLAEDIDDREKNKDDNIEEYVDTILRGRVDL